MIRHSFIVPGAPVGKARPRMTKRGTVYTPAKTIAAEKAVQAAARDAGVSIMSGPVQLSIHAWFAIPKSWTKARKAAAFAKFCTSKPDVDNIGKLVADALNGLAYADDAQVAILNVVKRYGSVARLDVSVLSIDSVADDQRG
jgi:Holliday junction resolvase RusA-like endonuclease